MSAATPSGEELRGALRQMVAVLQAERQALAGLDLDGITGCAGEKAALCGTIGERARAPLDPECRGLVEAAQRLNEVNRQLRNLIAANVARRLEAMTGAPALYRAPAGASYAYAFARR